jgi:transposase
VFAAFFGYLWCFTRIFVRTPHGRQRLNVLGALNAVSKKVVTVINETYVNATTVMELLDKLVLASPNIPITVVLDNARYQRCNAVIEHAQKLGIEMLFLPSYSPNLNLIERLWKLVKKLVLNSQYYPDFKSFREGIINCLTTLHEKHEDELKSLLALKFQTFEKLNSQTK